MESSSPLKLSGSTPSFNGEEDSIFQQFSKDGKRFIEYVEIIGSFDDMPHDRFIEELRKHYGHLFQGEKDLGRLLKSLPSL